MSVLRTAVARMPGARLQGGERGLRLVFEVDGVWLDARARDATAIEIYVRTIDLQGTTLRAWPSLRRLDHVVPTRTARDGFGYYHDEDVGAAVDAARATLAFAADYDVELDGPLAAHWLDEPARAALTAALWVRFTSEALAPGLASAGYRYSSTATEIAIMRDNELDPERLLAALRAGATLAARPHRLGRAWLDVARGLGGTTTEDRFDVGGPFAAVFERGATTIRIDHVMRLRDDDRAATLATRLRARRIAPDGDAWALAPRQLPWKLPRLPRLRGVDAPPDLPAGWALTATAPARALARLRPLLAQVTAAAPAAMWASGDEVGVVWPDLMMDPARLGPAIDLAARLAFEADAAIGPYR